MGDGMLRRGIVGTLVHVADPTEIKPGEDLSDIAIPQSQWVNNSRLQDEWKEKWRKARKADLTVGELEEMQRKLAAS
jgi:hypothetical protein